ncbi:MAG: sulfite exporter TauE/SafE family protein [Capsulimonadaceae bacterium]|nr:sulfite exporter TauE/SafE family protein [Capsulimonadaceae bacterium]
MHGASYVFLAAASLAAGAINSVAGGGTVLTFPALLAAGVPPVTANATSTIALVTGSLTSAYGYREEVGRSKRLMIWMIVPSVIGGTIGALLVLHAGDAVLKKLVPWLILGATVLFLAQEPISRWLRATQEKEIKDAAEGRGHDPDNPEGKRLATVLFYQFFVAIYGGFFGAGIGILQLAALGFLGLTNIHRMNAVKNVTSSAINIVASAMFILGGRVNWPIAVLMGVAAIAGGYGGAGVARKIGQQRVRQIIIGIGFAIAGLMFYRQMHGGM